MEKFRHRSPKNRRYPRSATVSDNITDWASPINSRDGLSKNITDSLNRWRFLTVTVEPEAYLVQPKPISCDGKKPSPLNCHIIIDAYEAADMDDDVDTTSSYWLTGQNTRWAKFGPIWAILKAKFYPFSQAYFSILQPIFITTFKPIFQPISTAHIAHIHSSFWNIQPIYTEH